MSDECTLVSWTLPSRRDQLPQVRTDVRDLAAHEGFKEEDISQITLAVDEALANVIQHGYAGVQDQPIHFRIDRVTQDDRRGIRITIRDFGKQVDPASIRSRDLDEIRPGGLGVHIMREVMDEVTYACADDCGMLLTMTKWQKIPPHASETS